MYILYILQLSSVSRQIEKLSMVSLSEDPYCIGNLKDPGLAFTVME